MVNLRLTHPTLFFTVIAYAMINIGLGLNFYFTNPTFNPYEIDYDIIATSFTGLGVAELFCLLWWQNLQAIRITMATCAAYMLWWGLGNFITYFQGKTSLQLFCLFAGLASLQILLLLEPYVNPITKAPPLKPPVK